MIDTDRIRSATRAHRRAGSNFADPAVRALIRRGLPPIAGGVQGARLQSPEPGLRPHVRQTPEGAAVIPFTSASHKQTEGTFVNETFTPGGAESALDSPHEIPAGGYLRNVWLLVTATGGTLGAGVLSADYPFNILSRIALTDVNGAPIYGPTDGYATLWQNIIGGAAQGINDPRVLPLYVGTINAAFAIRIPIEISQSTALGCLSNQDARAGYRVELRGNTSANLFSTAPTTIPAVQVRAFVERWTIPSESDVLGRPQAQMPPRLGTAQYVSEYLTDIAAGANTIELTRTGSLVRTLLFIARTAAGARSDTVFPNPTDIDWNQRHIHSGLEQSYITSVEMREKLADLSARDAGVFALPHNVSNHGLIGDDLPTLWWPTVQSARLEVRGSAAAAGRLQIITGDVAPAEVVPEERYELGSETGFHPEVGTQVRQG